MPEQIVNPKSVIPMYIKPGDTMLITVKAVMNRQGVYRLYRCDYDGPAKPGGSVMDIPQGSRVLTDEDKVCEALFPSLAMVAKADDL